VANTRGGILAAARQPDTTISDVHIGCFSVTVAVQPNVPASDANAGSGGGG